MTFYLNKKTLLLQSFPVPTGDDWLEILEPQPAPHYVAKLIDGLAVWVEPPLPVPQSCTNRQGKLALIELGLYTQALDLLAAITDPVQKLKADVEWSAPTFERTSPFLNGVWQQLQQSQEQLDDAFRLAVTL